MNVLVALKQTVHADQFARLRLSANGDDLEMAGLDLCLDPIGEGALETALRLTEDARAKEQRLGEVVTVSLGPISADSMLRSTLALGASQAIRVATADHQIDGLLTAHAIAALARDVGSTLILLGQQSADGDGGDVAARIAALLGWPGAYRATTIVEQFDGTLLVERDLEMGKRLCTELEGPAVVSVDLPVTRPTAVRSRHTPTDHAYPEGIRYAPLPAIMAARRRTVHCRSLVDLVGERSKALSYVGYELPAPRGACVMVQSTAQLAKLMREKGGLS